MPFSKLKNLMILILAVLNVLLLCLVIPLVRERHDQRELAAEQLAAGRLKEVKLTDDTLERQYFIAYNKKKYLTGRMKEVLQVLKL